MVLSWLVSYVGLPVSLLYLTKYLWKLYFDGYKDESNSLPLPPGTYGWPFIGNSLSFIIASKKGNYYRDMREKFGPVYKTHLFGKPMVRVCGEKAVAGLLLNDYNNFKKSWMKAVQDLLGPYALTNSPVENHKDKRKTFMRAFGPDALEEYVILLKNIVEREMVKWANKPSVKVHSEIELMAYYAVCEVLLGIPDNIIKSDKFHSDFCDYIMGFFGLPLNLPGTTFNKGLKARESMRVTLRPFVREMIASANKNDAKTISGIEFIMSDHRAKEHSVSESELLDTILEILFTAHITVVSSMTSLTMFLGKNPNVMKKLDKEFDDNGIKNISTDFTYKKLQTLSYLSDTIKETLRITPPAGAVIRQTHKTTEIDGYQVPKGWLVTCGIGDVHDQDASWSDADRDKFNPDRWATPAENLTKHGFIPYGVGPRVCAGRSYVDVFLRVLAINLVKGYDYQLENPNPFLKRFPVIYPEDKLPARFSKKA